MARVARRLFTDCSDIRPVSGYGVTLGFTANPKVHAVLAVMNWILLVAFVALFGVQLGGVARLMT